MGQKQTYQQPSKSDVILKYKEDSTFLYRLSLIFLLLCIGLQPARLKIKKMMYDI